MAAALGELSGVIERRRSIRTFALVCVGVTSFYVMGMRIWSQWLLGHADWCGRALGAAKYANGRPEMALGHCFQLQALQVKALAQGSLIDGGVVALCLLVLMLIVVAGGRLSFKASHDGVEGDISSDQATRAARRTAAAAEQEAEEIAGESGEAQ